MSRWPQLLLGRLWVGQGASSGHPGREHTWTRSGTGAPFLGGGDPVVAGCGLDELEALEGGRYEPAVDVGVFEGCGGVDEVDDVVLAAAAFVELAVLGVLEVGAGDEVLSGA